MPNEINEETRRLASLVPDDLEKRAASVDRYGNTHSLGYQKELRDQAAAIRALIASATDTCEWKQSEDYSYDTGCGVRGAFIFASGWMYCPHCGKLIASKQTRKEELK